MKHRFCAGLLIDVSKYFVDYSLRWRYNLLIEGRYNVSNHATPEI